MMPLRTVRRRARRGLTILEVMLATAIVIFMSAIAWSSLGTAIELNQALAEGDATTRSARAALGLLRRELQLAFLTESRQAVNSYQTVFVGEDQEPDSLVFSTLSHRRLYRDSREADQAEISIWGERSPRDKGEGYILYHREAGRIDQFPDEGGHIYPLAYNVRSFNLRYLDGQTNEWRDDWDTRGADTPYRLPRAVQIGLVLIAPDPRDPDRTIDVPFLTTVLLHYAPPVQPLLGDGTTTMTPTLQ